MERTLASPRSRGPAPVAGDERAPLRDGADVLLCPVVSSSGETAVVTAIDALGRPVGRGAFLRVYGPRADLTLEVDEQLWHLGLPDALVDALRAIAARLGISTLLARVPASDVRLLALLCERFGAREVRDGELVHAELKTAPQPWPDGR